MPLMMPTNIIKVLESIFKSLIKKKLLTELSYDKRVD